MKLIDPQLLRKDSVPCWRVVGIFCLANGTSTCFFAAPEIFIWSSFETLGILVHCKTCWFWRWMYRKAWAHPEEVCILEHQVSCFPNTEGGDDVRGTLFKLKTTVFLFWDTTSFPFWDMRVFHRLPYVLHYILLVDLSKMPTERRLPNEIFYSQAQMWMCVFSAFTFSHRRLRIWQDWDLVAITNEDRGKRVTLVACYSASGVHTPQLVIYNHQTRDSEMAESGYINMDAFLNCLECSQKDGPLENWLLILEGRVSHWKSMHLFGFCIEMTSFLCSCLF